MKASAGSSRCSSYRSLVGREPLAVVVRRRSARNAKSSGPEGQASSSPWPSRSRGRELLDVRRRSASRREPSTRRSGARSGARCASTGGPHRDDEQMARSRNDLEPRVRQPRLPPASVPRVGERVARAVEQERLRLDRLRLEAPRLQAVPGDVGGETAGALDERGVAASRPGGSARRPSGVRPRRPSRAPRSHRASRREGILRDQRGEAAGRAAACASSGGRARSRSSSSRCSASIHGTSASGAGVATTTTRSTRSGRRAARASATRPPADQPSDADASDVEAVEHGGEVVRGGCHGRPSSGGDGMRAAVARPVDREQADVPRPGLRPDRGRRCRRPARCGRRRRRAPPRSRAPVADGTRPRASSCGGRRPAGPTRARNAWTRP